MNRVLGHDDICPYHTEQHIPCAGGSIGTPMHTFVNQGGIIGTWKFNRNVQMDSAGVLPMGLGHDAGPGRIHIMVCPSPEPATMAALSAMSSALTTALSSVKPMFSAHTVQLSVSGSMLPICVDPTPYGIGSFSAMFCGMPSETNFIPLIPSQSTVVTSMTLGDYIGGIVNMIVEFYWSLANLPAAIAGAGGFCSSKIFGVTVDFASNLFSFITRASDGSGTTSFGPSNWGVAVQRLIDNDGVYHDADPGVGFGLMGSVSLESDGEGSGLDYDHFIGDMIDSSSENSSDGSGSQGASRFEQFSSAYPSMERMWR